MAYKIQRTSCLSTLVLFTILLTYFSKNTQHSCVDLHIRMQPGTQSLMICCRLELGRLKSTNPNNELLHFAPSDIPLDVSHKYKSIRLSGASCPFESGEGGSAYHRSRTYKMGSNSPIILSEHRHDPRLYLDPKFSQ